MNLTVERRHIEAGKKDNALHNPIALAAQDRDPFAVVTSRYVHMGCHHGLSCTAPKCGVEPLPTFAVDWLRRFNAGEVVLPICIYT